MLKYFLYHENHQEKLERPQEDYFLAKNNIFIVADGITHDLIDGKYPHPSDSFLVAKMASESIFESLNSKIGVEESFRYANKQIKKFQKNRELYKNREKNNYTFGATVIAAAIFKNNKIYYGVLDDCSIAVFDRNFNDRLKLIPYVENSTKYLFQKYHWQDPEGRKFWRKNIRNHQIKVGSKIYGYGVLDGHGNYQPFLQTGEIELKSDDLICIYSDGFIKPLSDNKFMAKIEKIRNKEEARKYISIYSCQHGLIKEKTCYFIKNS